MNVKTALDFYKQFELNVKSDKKKFGKAMVTPEEIALRTMVSAYLKQRLVIKQLQKNNSNLKKVVNRWNSFQNKL